MKRRNIKKKDGSALLIAIVIMMVTMMLSLALLLVSYSLFATANKQQNLEQCKELAQSLSVELEKEITDPIFESYAEETAALEAGEYPLWFYLRYNVFQSSWPYYNEDERGHTQAYAYRYFKIDTPETDVNVADDISVLMYWSSELDTETENENEAETTELTVVVTCEKGKQRSTITTIYELVLGEDSNYDDAPQELVRSPNKDVNPNNNAINGAQKWSWGREERG